MAFDACRMRLRTVSAVLTAMCNTSAVCFGASCFLILPVFLTCLLIMKKQAYLQPQPSVGPPMLGSALFFPFTSIRFPRCACDHESRSKTTSSASHLGRVYNYTPLIRFRLLSYFIHSWHSDCFFISFILCWLQNSVIRAMPVISVFWLNSVVAE